MSGIFDAGTIDLFCENCMAKTRKTIRWVKTHRAFTCKCGARTATTQFTGQVRSAERKVADLQRKIRSVNKRK